MKLYILKLYGTPHKEKNACDIGGYFTSKSALVHELKKHAEEIGEIWGGGFHTIEEHAKFDFRYFDSDFANIEVENLNSWAG